MPALAELLVQFFPLLAAIVLAGLSQTLTAQQGSAETPGFWDYLSGGLLKQLGGFAAKLARYVASHFAVAQLRLIARWLMALGTLAGGLLVGLPLFAEAITAAVERVERRGDPKARHKAAGAAAAAAAAAKAARHANAHANTVGGALNAYKAHANPRIAHATHAVDVTLPHDIAGLRARNKALEREQTKERTAIGEIEHGATKTWEWLNAHRASAAMGAFTGAVLWALSRVGYGFLRCRSWQRLGKSLTCNDANVLADLLAAATLVVGAMSLVELAREEQKVMGEAAKLVRGFWEV